MQACKHDCNGEEPFLAQARPEVWDKYQVEVFVFSCARAIASIRRGSGGRAKSEVRKESFPG